MRMNVSKIVGRHLNECMYCFKFSFKKQSLVLDAYISTCNVYTCIWITYRHQYCTFLLSLLLNIFFPLVEVLPP